MKINKIILISAVAALLAAGCGKEAGDGYIKLFAERMDLGGHSKVLMDPDDVNGASWVADEQIDLNGSPCTIKGNSTDGFYLDGVAPLSSTMYAVYPAAIHQGSNHIAVTNIPGSTCMVAIHSLAIDFTGDGRQRTYFPMAALADPNSGTLHFKHLTGCLRLTLNNTSSDEMEMDSLVIGVIAPNGDPAIYKALRPSAGAWTAWPSGTLPALPSGEVGNTHETQGAEFVKTMSFSLRTNGTIGITIPANGSVTFCIPMLAKEFLIFYVEGFYQNHQIFNKNKVLDNPLAIERNKIYTLPSIDLH